jgi:hypothetical protein
MDKLQLINTIVSGLLSMLLSKTGIVNIAFKVLFMVLFVYNVLRLAGRV